LITYIFAFDKVRSVQRIVDGFTTRFRVCPFPQLLGKPAVVSMSPSSVRQTFCVHQSLHVRLSGLARRVIGSGAKQNIQGDPLGRCFGMKWKVD